MTGSISYRPLVPPRITAITGIVALHLLIAYLLLTALVQPPPKEAPPPAITAWFTPDPPRIPPAQTPPRPRDIDVTRPRPRDVRFPDRIVTEPVHADVPVVAGTAEPPAPPSPARQEEPIRVLGRHWLPSSEAYYPPDLIRNGVQGDTQVRACVDESGRLAGGDQPGEPGVVDVAGKITRVKPWLPVTGDQHQERNQRIHRAAPADGSEAGLPSRLGWRCASSRIG